MQPENAFEGSMPVRHLDEVSLANMLFKMRKVKGYTASARAGWQGARFLSHCFQNTHTQETIRLCLRTCVLTHQTVCFQCFVTKRLATIAICFLKYISFLGAQLWYATSRATQGNNRTQTPHENFYSEWLLEQSASYSLLPGKCNIIQLFAWFS